MCVCVCGVSGLFSFYWPVSEVVSAVAWVHLSFANEEPDSPSESTSCPSQIQAKSGHASLMHESSRLDEMSLST